MDVHGKRVDLNMEKAAAFVTDHGGMLSHAAIIARELGKPCIVGTDTATKTFKDGDLIKVDADKGLVKILKKQKDLFFRQIFLFLF